MAGVSSRLSLRVAGSSMKASLGEVSGVVAEVVHKVAPLAFVADHPAGSAGATTPSKFSPRATLTTPVTKSNVIVPRLVAPSCSWRLATIVEPHETLPAVKVNDLDTVLPPAV